MGNCASGASARLRADSSLALEFPMFTIIVKDIVQLSHPVPHHEELLEQGLVVRHRSPSVVVIFVSHQWVGKAHPDPIGEQFKVLQRAFRRLAGSGLDIKLNLSSEAEGFKQLLPSKDDLQRVMEWHVWYDFFSCPQRGSHADLLAAVSSIPAYVDQCSYFLVLAPPVMNSEQASMRDFQTWKQRGWCRLELASCMLSVNEKTPLTLAGAKSLRTMHISDWLFHWPGHGEFTVEADRPIVGRIVNALLSQKMLKYKKRGDMNRFRLIAALEQNAMRGLERQTADRGALDDFCRRYEIDTDDTTSELTPLMLASIENNVQVVKELVVAGADRDRGLSAVLQKDRIWQLPKGHSAYSLAALFGSTDVVRCFLDARADPDQSYGANAKPTMFQNAASIGHLEVMKLMLERRADIHRGNIVGTDALCAAAIHSVRADVVEWLLLQRADPNCGNIFGGSTLKAACAYGVGADLVRLLIDAAADVNARGKAKGFGRCAVKGCQLATRMGRKKSALMTAIALNEQPPLFHAVLAGALPLMSLLLERRADPAALGGLDGRTSVSQFAAWCGEADIVAKLAGEEPSASLSLSTAARGEAETSGPGAKAVAEKDSGESLDVRAEQPCRNDEQDLSEFDEFWMEI